ncbi:MAG TPA: hypothetical protein VGO21_01980 [Candidatus Paceibacterota bacterium]|nr:hypothetical protein [Candidatus Paceibacterota bacterium]
MSRLFIIVILCTSFIKGFSQQSIPYDTNAISKAKELNFSSTQKRGIETPDGMIYVVGKNLKVLTAYEHGKIKWQSDIIISCGMPSVGKPEIRYLKLDGNKIYLTFGKHDYAKVNTADGKVECLGSD